MKKQGPTETPPILPLTLNKSTFILQILKVHIVCIQNSEINLYCISHIFIWVVTHFHIFIVYFRYRKSKHSFPEH